MPWVNNCELKKKFSKFWKWSKIINLANKYWFRIRVLLEILYRNVENIRKCRFFSEVIFPVPVSSVLIGELSGTFLWYWTRSGRAESGQQQASCQGCSRMILYYSLQTPWHLLPCADFTTVIIYITDLDYYTVDKRGEIYFNRF